MKGDHLSHFNAVQDIVPEESDTVHTLRWVEEWRGEAVRSRLVVRQHNNSMRDDVFQATPDTWFMRWQLVTCSAHPERDPGGPECYACAVIDISCAFMHADALERVIVKVPPGIQSMTGYCICLGLNGGRKASQGWGDHSATILQSWGAQRNNVNPSIFRMPDEMLDLGIHGDDYLLSGPTSQVLRIVDKFKQFFCKESRHSFTEG